MSQTGNKFLKLYIKDCHQKIRELTKCVCDYKEAVRQELTPDEMALLDSELSRFYDFKFVERKLRQIRKFDYLIAKRPEPEPFRQRSGRQEKWLVNLSDRKLTNDEKRILERPLNFAVLPKHIPVSDILCGVEEGLRKATLSQPLKEDIRNQVANTLRSYKKVVRNSSKDELALIKALRDDSTIKICKADKGNVTVILNVTDYDDKITEILSDTSAYKELKRDPTSVIERKMNKLLTEGEETMSRPALLSLKSSDGVSPELYGLVKIHKTPWKLRPIVSFIDSPTYSLSQWLSRILGPLFLRSVRDVKNSYDFIEEIRHLKLHDNHRLISLDVQNLFPSIPIPLAMDILTHLTMNDDSFDNRCKISKTLFLRWLEFTLSHTAFRFQDKFFEQVVGLPMGAPISVIVANIVMRSIEQKALDQLVNRPLTYKRFIDDLFLIVEKDDIDSCFHIFDSIHPAFKFTLEEEQDKALPFLDVLIKRCDNGSLSTSVFRKPTHSGRYLSFSSTHPTMQKKAVISSLVTRAKRLCSDENALDLELKHIRDELTDNDYPSTFIDKIITQTRRKESDPVLTPKATPVRTTIPYWPGLSEQLGRILRQADIQTVYSCTRSLRHLLIKNRQPVDAMNRKHVVYSIPCKDCDKIYVGQTNRMLKTRLKEHMNDCRVMTKRTALVEHVIDEEHRPNFPECGILQSKPLYYQRIFSEAWHIAKENAIANKKSGELRIPDQYLGLMT